MRDRIEAGAGGGMGVSDQREAMSWISNVCALAKELERNLPTLAAHPHLLRSSLEVIARTADKAVKLLPFNHHPPADQLPSSSYSTHMAFAPDHEDSLARIIDMLLQQKLGVEGGGGVELAMGNNVIGKRDFGIQYSPEALALSRPASHELLGTDTPASSVAGEALQGVECSKKRKESPSTYTITVTAPCSDNLGTAPDDGFTWRKYGQKRILNSKFPRSYYRCTHKNFYGCEAKKYVQRLDEDPHKYKVIYKGLHTCNTSTVPLIPGPQAAMQQLQEMAGARGNSSSGCWLSVGMGGMEAGKKEMRNDQARNIDVEFEKEVEPLADYTAVLFSYGSSSKTLDAIFPSCGDK